MPKPKNQRTPEEEKRVQEAQAYIKQREKLASQAGTSKEVEVRKAAQALIPQEDVRAAEAQKQQALATLQPQQTAELTQISGKLNEVLNPQTMTGGLPKPNPNLPGGIAQADTIKDIVAATGGDLVKYDQAKNAITTGATVAGTAALAAGATTAATAAAVPVMTSSAATMTGALGKIGGFGKLLLGGLGIGGVTTIVNALTSGRVSELEGDISIVVGHSRMVVVDVKSGGDALQAINQLKDAESQIWDMAGKLHVALGTDARAWLRNKSEEEFLFAALDTIARRRQALERYAITKNPAELDAIIGLELPQ